MIPEEYYIGTDNTAYAKTARLFSHNFGSESQKNWYQTLPSGRGRSHKEHFYNPIMQNRSHIKHLKAFLNKEIPMYSVITFLKDVH